MANKTPQMSKLSNEVKNLVNEGVYSLYVLCNYNEKNAQYALITNHRELYLLLSSDGEILEKGSRRSPKENLGKTVTYDKN